MQSGNVTFLHLFGSLGTLGEQILKKIPGTRYQVANCAESIQVGTNGKGALETVFSVYLGYLCLIFTFDHLKCLSMTKIQINRKSVRGKQFFIPLEISDHNCIFIFSFPHKSALSF